MKFGRVILRQKSEFLSHLKLRQNKLFSATAALAAVQLKRERHLIFQVVDVNFLVHFK